MVEPHAKGTRPLLMAVIVLLLLLLACGSVPAVGVVAAIAIPNFIVYQQRATRSEIPSYVEAIRAAQIAYGAVFDGYLAIPEPVPLAPLMLSDRPVDWPSGTGFDELGWEPGGSVNGTYWVEVSPDGSDFTVHGMCDVDGDGEPAHYTATRNTRATLETMNGVY